MHKSTLIRLGAIQSTSIHSLLLIALLLLAVPSLRAQQVTHDDWQSLQVHFTTGDLEYGKTVLGGTTYATLSIDNYMPSSSEGKPCLPTFSQLIEVPLCDGFAVTVTDAEYDTLPLPGGQLMPSQPSRSKSDTSAAPTVIDTKLYATDNYYGQEEAMVEAIGIARDRRLARLQFSPIRYNPVRGLMIVCRQATVTVRYLGADREASESMWKRYYSPAFSTGAKVLNSLYPKSVSTTAPIRYLIVAHSSFRGQLNNFVQWKRRKGFITDIVYTDSAAVGTTTTTISAYIQSQYNNATASCPAPTYLLIVGDHEQIPAFTGTTSTSHITDLYYISWTTGDNLPDCYCGRFSAQTVTELIPQIQKTLMYEQYTFTDPSFLDRAVLIAGVDGGSSGDYGYTHADPAMDYAATHYINATQGFTQVRYFKNNTSIVPSATGVTIGSSASSNSATVRSFYNQGAGWINYSAHGSATSWGTPNFTTTHVASMTNTEKFGLMIGNCCLTNKFETTTCFGEALLRKDEYCGAVGYIGGSNSTYWYEDFYWAVGLRNSIGPSMSMAYDASNLGAYDRLCHTHGETYSQWAMSQGSVMMVGNMAVESSTSSRKLYYWEIYHLMGDPSVMPYLTQASVMTISAPSLITSSTTSLTVTAAPYAYVALTDTLTHTLVAAAYANNMGSATLSLPATLPLGGYELAASAQQYRTAFHPIAVIVPSGAFPVVTGIASATPLIAGDTVSLLFTVANPGDSTARGITIDAIPSDTTALTLLSSMPATIDSLPAGDTVVLNLNAYVSPNATDGTSITITTNTSHNTATIPNTSTHRLALIAPAVAVEITPANSNIQPGTTTTLTVTLTNEGHAPFNNGRLTIASPTSSISLLSGVSDTTVYLSLAPSASTSLNITLQAASTLPSGIEVPLSFAIGHDNSPSDTTTHYLYVGNNNIETFEGNTFHTTGWSQGTYAWVIANSDAYAGSYCLRSGTISHNQSSEISMAIVLNTADSISFYYSVSSESGYDKFHFYIDNNDMVSESGVVNWSRAAFLIPAGSHTLRFTYEKDYSVNRNSDCAWIDNITLPRNPQPVVFGNYSLCVGDLYVVGPDTINTSVPGSGSISAQVNDTVFLTDYTVHPSYTTESWLAACDSVQWNGSTYTTSTDITDQNQTAYGCDSAYVMHLTVNPSYYLEETVTACDSLIWVDSIYTASTYVSQRFTTINGCDSTTMLHLTVNHSTLDIIHDTCYDSVYYWNDSVYHKPGDYIQVLTTAEGCDSIVILLLTFDRGTTEGIDPTAELQPANIYPNPTTRWLRMDRPVAKATLYTIAGQPVFEKHNIDTIDLASLPQGVYLLHIVEQGITTTYRVVKTSK